MNLNRNQKSKSRDLAELVIGMAFVWFTFLILAYHLYGDDTPRAQLPLMSFNEGQPHLTFNELAWFVDAMTFPALKSYPANASPDLNVPVAEGDLYIVPAGASGTWFGYDNDIAQYRNAAWDFITPATGWIVNKPDFSSLRYDGSAWTEWQGSVSSTIIHSVTLEMEYLALKGDALWGISGWDVTGTTNYLQINRYPDDGDKIPIPGMNQTIYDYARLTLGADLGSAYSDYRIHFNPIGPSWIPMGLSIGRGNNLIMYSGETLGVGGAILMDATGEPADPTTDNIGILWFDTSGNLRLKSRVSGVTKTATLFTY